MVVLKEIDELKEMFNEFEKIHIKKTKSKGWFERQKLYDNYLQIDTEKIIMCVQNAIYKAKQ